MEIKEIIRRWQAGEGPRQIAAGTGLSRNTVRKYLAAARLQGITQGGLATTDDQLSRLATISRVGPRQAATPQQDQLEPWADQIYQWITKDRLQMTRIHELLGMRGCQLSYQSLRRFIINRNWRRRSKATVRMADTPPGEVAEADFGRLGMITDPATGKRKAVWAMVIVLCHSRHCFVWPMMQHKLPDVIAGLEAAWAFFGGMPKYLVIDNFPAAVVGTDPLNPILTRGFLEYAQHRGFIPDPARKGHPQDKPKVADFDDFTHVRAAAPKWCLEVAGMRIHGTTHKKPLVVFQDEERHALIPWDGIPYEIANWRTNTVHQDFHIKCLDALYSVPSHLCRPGRKVEVRVDSKLVRIYHRGQLIKTHERQPKGGRSTDVADYPPKVAPYTTRAPDGLKREAAKLGTAVGEFAERLFEGNHPWSKIRQGHKLLRLGDRYTAQRLDAACQRALDVDLIDVYRVENILVQALEEETTPQLPLPLLTGRFARPGSVFAQSDPYRRKSA